MVVFLSSLYRAGMLVFARCLLVAARGSALTAGSDCTSSSRQLVPSHYVRLLLSRLQCACCMYACGHTLPTRQQQSCVYCSALVQPTCCGGAVVLEHLRTQRPCVDQYACVLQLRRTHTSPCLLAAPGRCTGPAVYCTAGAAHYVWRMCLFVVCRPVVCLVNRQSSCCSST